MTDTQKRKGAPRKSFSHDDIEALRDAYIEIPDELMMAVDTGFSEVLKALDDGGFHQLETLSSLDCLKPHMHKKLQDFARVVKHRKSWYARLEVIRRKPPKSLSLLERQALKLDGIEGREAYISLQKALKACVDADENRAKEVDLAKRLENRAESLRKQAERGTSPTAERRARTAWLCFLGATFEKATSIVGYEPIAFLEGMAKQAQNAELFSFLEEVKQDKRNRPTN
jgi:hypothetical protein|uniref:Uncharacterized protein n=1 Tax=uncultured prokaryote TaxID=198431 RepID=A0A0H5PX60_9ZZZZ|nr:hypothetical protein [uncultured prokaryote]